jgi:predicted DNA-binding transcriptional regulator YafY
MITPLAPLVAPKPPEKPSPKNPLSILVGIIQRAMRQPDDFVLVLEYLDKDGSKTRRVVSPIRFLGTDRFLALCLAREEPRQFYFSRCKSARIDLAIQYVMPVSLETLS